MARLQLIDGQNLAVSSFISYQNLTLREMGGGGGDLGSAVPWPFIFLGERSQNSPCIALGEECYLIQANLRVMISVSYSPSGETNNRGPIY